MAKRRRMSEKELAYAVLQQAVEDLAYDFESLYLWCGLLELNPQDFRQRVIRLSKKDGACGPAYEVIELLDEEE